MLESVRESSTRREGTGSVPALE